MRQVEVGTERTMIDGSMDRFEPLSRATDRRQRLWLRADAGLARRGTRDRAASPSRQVGTQRRDLERANFADDRRAALGLPGGKDAQSGHRRRVPTARPRSGVNADDALSRQQAALQRLPAQSRGAVPASRREDHLFDPEGARDMPREIASTDGYVVSTAPQKVEMLLAHLKRVLHLDRLRLRGPCGARDNSTSPPHHRTLIG